MLINESEYQAHLAHSHECAYRANYFSNIPSPTGNGEAVSCGISESENEYNKFLLKTLFTPLQEVKFPQPLGVDEETDLFLTLETEMDLVRPDSHRYRGGDECETIFALSCYDPQNLFCLPNYKKGETKQVFYGSLFGTLPYYGPHVKLYKVDTKKEKQTKFSPKGETYKRGEWALCPSKAESHFGFHATGAVAFHSDCIQEEVYLGPVSGLLSKFGFFKVGETIFKVVSPLGQWTVVTKNNVHSGDWGGWAYALAAYYGLMD